jgi:hypothetical protein
MNAKDARSKITNATGGRDRFDMIVLLSRALQNRSEPPSPRGGRLPNARGRIRRERLARTSEE